MKRTILFLTVIAIGFLFMQKAEANVKTGVSVNIGFFYSTLAPHGHWIEMEPGFVVWRPHRIDRYWRPYMFGRWVWTNYGWYWLSNEPFGWVTYHYGRWYYDNYYGWIWIPDDVWGPAWVEWRYDDDYIGWAPLPPYATFSFSIGIHFTRHWVAPYRYWTFVRYKHFGRVIQLRDIVPERQVQRIIGRTRSDHRYRVENERVVHVGVERNIIEQRTRSRIQEVPIEEVRKETGERPVLSNNKRDLERIQVYRPTREDLQRAVENPNLRRGDRKPSFDIKEITRQRSEPSKQTEIRKDREEIKIEQKQQSNEQDQKRIDRTRTRNQVQDKPETTQERRKELIQKHDDRPNPPVSNTRKNRETNIEKMRSPESSSPTHRNTPQRSSSRDDKRNRSR